jgi:hypothetical protein
MLPLLGAEFLFWTEYRDRVVTALQNDLSMPVTVMLPVKFGPVLQPLLQCYVDARLTELNAREPLVDSCENLPLEQAAATVSLPVEAAESQVQQGSEECYFQIQAQNVKIQFSGKSFGMRGSVGLFYIHYLLKAWQSNPASETPPTELVEQLGMAGRRMRPVGSQTRSSDEEIGEGYDGTGHSGPVSDREGFKAGREEARRLQVSLERAKKEGNTAQVDQILANMRDLLKYSQKAKKPDGSIVNLDDFIEKDRKAVSNGITRALKAIKEHSPNCADHLNRSIQRGRHLASKPAAAAPRWNLE